MVFHTCSPIKSSFLQPSRIGRFIVIACDGIWDVLSNQVAMPAGGCPTTPQAAMFCEGSDCLIQKHFFSCNCNTHYRQRESRKKRASSAPGRRGLRAPAPRALHRDQLHHPEPAGPVRATQKRDRGGELWQRSFSEPSAVAVFARNRRINLHPRNSSTGIIEGVLRRRRSCLSG